MWCNTPILWSLLKFCLAPNDDESQYASCEYERFDDLIEMYRFDSCHISQWVSFMAKQYSYK
jgi:hypothetical protein